LIISHPREVGGPGQNLPGWPRAAALARLAIGCRAVSNENLWGTAYFGQPRATQVGDNHHNKWRLQDVQQLA
jgi:hypothetical protein